MKSRAFKRIWGKPWDYGYLLKLEQYKIREMITYFKKYHHLTNWESVVREMQICDRLISIVLEEDTPYKGWLHTKYGKGKWNDKNPDYPYTKFPVYVNTKNSKRFLAQADYNNTMFSSPLLLDCAKISLRRQKALYLYNKIRSYCIQKWWD